MSAVYKARHVALGRDVALKLLPSATTDPTFARRLLFEARTIARLDHPNLVQVFDVGFQDGWFFMVMKLVRGRSLEDRLLEDPRPPLDDALSIMRDVARGLDAAHREGVIHRDLKPANVLVTEDGRACLTDFGLSRDSAVPDELDGLIVGTPCYMAPEIWQGEAVDGRTDLYSLGVIAYQMATGRRPFEAGTLAELQAQHLAGKAKAPRSLNPDCSPGLQAVMGKLMARSPDRRYADAAALLADLDRMARGLDPQALAGSSRRLKCGFCEALNRSDAAKCETCGEPLGAAAAAPLELALRKGEAACRACGAIFRAGLRACPSCRARVR
jgi:serine/threonine-protein kinase